MLNNKNHFIIWMLCSLLSFGNSLAIIKAEEELAPEETPEIQEVSDETTDTENDNSEETAELISDETESTDDEKTIQTSVETADTAVKESSETTFEEDELNDICQQDEAELETDKDVSDTENSHFEEGIEESTVYETSDGFEYIEEFDGAKITAYNGTARDVVIPESISGAGFVKYIGDGAFKGNNYIESVTIPQFVYTIGEEAFRDCINLKTVTLYDVGNRISKVGARAFYNCKKLIEIENALRNVFELGEYAFYNCESLKEVPFVPYSIEKGTYSHCKSIRYIPLMDVDSIGDYAFEYCTELQTGSIPDGITSIGNHAFSNSGISEPTGGSFVVPDSVTSLGTGAFSDCDNLSHITIGSGINKIADYLFEYCESLNEVVFSDNVTSIGKRAFSGCKVLSSVSIPNSLISIGESAFSSCEGLTELILPNTVTSIGEYAFYGCKGLLSITLPNSITEISNHAFQNCLSLNTIAIPSSVKRIGWFAFNGCSSLNNIVIPNGVTTLAQEAFSNCENLSKVTISKSVITLGDDVFAGCTELKTAGAIGSGSNIEFGWTTEIPAKAIYCCDGLTTLTIPNGITYIGDYAFAGNPNLVSITFPANEVRMGSYVFMHCNGLQSVTVPGNVVNIGWQAFSYCDSLTTVVIKDGVTTIDNVAFYNSTNISKIVIPESVVTIDGAVFGGCSKLKTAGPIGSGSNIEFGWKTEIPSNAFYYCDSLTNAVIPEGIKTINQDAFEHCTGLSSVTLPNSIRTIKNEAFYYCSNLSKINFPEGLTTIENDAFYECGKLVTAGPVGSGSNIEFGWTTEFPEHAFNNCNYLVSITIPNTITGIGQGAFLYCTSLKSVVLPDGITRIEDYTFQDCRGLTNIIIPSGVINIGDSAFSSCVNLKEVSIPEAVTDIGSFAFSGCETLQNINFPQGVSVIRYGTFNSCSNFTSIIIPDGVITIEGEAFQYCGNLTNITIPASVTSINGGTFYECNKLTDVYYAGTEAQWKKIDIDWYDNECLANAVIHYESSTQIQVEGVAFSTHELELAISESEFLQVSVLPSNASNKKVIFKSDHPEYVVVDENGKITGISEGTAIITVTTEDSGYTDTCAVTCYSVKATGITIDEDESDTVIEFGSFGTIKVKFEPSNTTDQRLMWATSNENVASIDENGRITAVGEGTTIITATTVDGGFTASKEITVIYHHVESIFFENVNYDIAKGKTIVLHLLFNPDNASNKNVTYESGNEEIVIVDQQGIITGVSEGTTVITARSEDGNKAATCTVTVVMSDVYIDGFDSQYMYTGSPIKPGFNLFDTGTLLTPKTDYTVTYKNNKKAYTLKEDDPGFNAKKAPQIIIKSNSKGNYKGSKTVYFTIDPVALSDSSITVDALALAETGKPLSPVPALYFNGKKLKAKTDYIVDYTGWDRLTGDENNEAVITVIAKENGNFSGERKVTVYIAPKGTTVPVSKLKVTAAALKYEDLTEENFAEKVKEAITVKDGKTGLQEGINYTVKDIKPENRAVGSFKVTLEGDGTAYIGERTVTVKITGIALSDKKIKAAVPSYEYTGEPQELGNDFSIKYNDELLEAGKDYTVESYSNNINAGTATVVLKGIGNYTGTRKVTFKITPADATGRKITLEDAYYTKGGSKPVVTVEGLSEGIDYTLKYADNKKVTDESVSKYPTVTITFKGNYMGSVRKDFFIDPKPLDLVTITAKDKVYSAKANAWKSAPVVKDTDGKTLKAGTDYDKNITYTTEDGDELPAEVEPGTVIKVTVTGKGSYTGTAEAFYHILETGKDISKATFKITNKEYTGSEVTLTAADITATINKTTPLELDTHYEIVGYTNNIKKGTAKVTFRGKGEYGGEKTVSFKIGQRNISTYWNGIKSFFSDLF